MCGLFGIASTGILSTKEKDFFETLGKLSTSRGKDSTGVFQMKLIKYPTEKEKEAGYKFYFHHIKDVCEPTYFFNRKEWKTTRGETNHVLMGHNRHATVGEVTKAAAHPFIISDKENRFLLSGMHNGTLADYVDKGGVHHSDSHKLYERVAEIGLKSALEELKEKSAYALAYVDNHAQPTFFRNNKRTLYFAMTKNKGTVVWASEERFIKAAETMHDIGIEGITLMATNQLVRLDLFDKDIKFVVAKDYLKKEVIELHEKDYVYNPNSYWANGGNYGRNTRKSWQSALTGDYSNYESEEEAWASTYGEAQRSLLTTSPFVTSLQNGIAQIKSLRYDEDRGHLVIEKFYVRNPQVTNTAYIYRGNPDYMNLMQMWEEQEHKRLGIPYLQLNNKDEVIVTLNTSKKKNKKKVIGKGHHNYYGWLDLFEQQEQSFEDWALAAMNMRSSFEGRFDKRVMNFNAMSKEAAQFSKFYREERKKIANEKEEKESKEEKEGSSKNNVLALPDFVTKGEPLPPAKVESTPPWEKIIDIKPEVKKEVRKPLEDMFCGKEGTAFMDGLVYDTGWSCDSIELANNKLTWGCQACDNPQIVQSVVYWMNSGEFVCESCYVKEETRQSLPKVKSARIGKVRRQS
jgi:hypothetical protein